MSADQHELWDSHDVARYLGIVEASVRKLVSFAKHGIGAVRFPYPPDAAKPDRWYAHKVRAYAAARLGRGAPGKRRNRPAA